MESGTGIFLTEFVSIVTAFLVGVEEIVDHCQSSRTERCAPFVNPLFGLKIVVCQWELVNETKNIRH
jgi:hypothetical protein